MHVCTCTLHIIQRKWHQNYKLGDFDEIMCLFTFKKSTLFLRFFCVLSVMSSANDTTTTTAHSKFTTETRPAGQYLRDSYFSDVANDLLADHDNRQLNAEINHTARSSTAVQAISSTASKSPIVARCTYHQIQLEEGDVENGWISVDELEQEHLVGKAVLVIGFCSRVFPIRQPQRQLLIEEL